MLDKVIEVVVAYVSPFLSVGTLVTVIGWIVSSVRHNKRLKLNSGLTGNTGVSDKTVADLKVRLADLEDKLEQSEAARKEDNKAAADAVTYLTTLTGAVLEVQSMAYAESGLNGDTKTNIKNTVISALNSSKSFKDDVKAELGELRETLKVLGSKVDEKAANIEKRADGDIKPKRVIR